jgi:hypothetical protein
MPHGINEHYPPALALIKAAEDFLVDYVKRDDNWRDGRHTLAAAASDVVLSASYVDSEWKHGLLHAAHKKIKRAEKRAERAHKKGSVDAFGLVL